MSSESDPQNILNALDNAVDAFNEAGYGIPDYEPDIERSDDWEIQLTKGCKLRSAASYLADRNQHTAVIELSFGVIERSFEALALAEGGDDLQDFHDHIVGFHGPVPSQRLLSTMFIPIHCFRK